MFAVRVVQMAVHEIINVIPMRHSLMSAICAMHMIFWMTCSAMSASIRMFLVYFEDVLSNIVAFNMLQMAPIEVVDMPVMFHSEMPATGPVFVSALIFSRDTHIFSSQFENNTTLHVMPKQGIVRGLGKWARV